MKPARQILLEEIESFLETSGMKPTNFGLECLNDSALITRLRAGSDVTLGTADKIRLYMRNWKPPKVRPTKRAALQSAA
jgi:hypothetical protein